MRVKCKDCGSVQDLSESTNCEFCGNFIKIEVASKIYQKDTDGELGGLIDLSLTAIDAGNWIEAISYFNQILQKDPKNSNAWLGKGIATVNTSKIGDLKIKEAISYWKNAITHSENIESMSKRVSKEIHSTVKSFYPILENHFVKFVSVDSTYGDHLNRYILLNSALDYANQLDPKNLEIIKTGIKLSYRMNPKTLATKKPKYGKLSKREEISWKALATTRENHLTRDIRNSFIEKMKLADLKFYEDYIQRQKEIKEYESSDKKKYTKLGVIGVIAGFIGAAITPLIMDDTDPNYTGGIFWMFFIPFALVMGLGKSLVGIDESKKPKELF
ncbi:tetratricopeptide repeat protein [Flavobacteriaceae bacterium]|nr:tetratricopeptide repeat protein [Flavobacteriaceae bacterium]